jgi:type IV pilus assembly protein PilO
MAFDFNTMSKQGQWGVIGFFCAALAGVFYYYIWSPNAVLETRLRTEIGEIQLENQRTRQVADQLPQLEIELGEAEAQLATLSNILPEEQQTDALLRSLQQAASESNLAIRRTNFPAPIMHDFYAEMPMELDLVGTYHDLALFFDRISKFGRVVTVGQITIRTLAEEAYTIQATCTASTFFFLPEVATPVEGAAATGATANAAAPARR